VGDVPVDVVEQVDIEVAATDREPLVVRQLSSVAASARPPTYASPMLSALTANPANATSSASMLMAGERRG
jgi:hypothetical protein